MGIGLGAQATMIQNLEWYSVFPLVTGFMALALGMVILRKNRRNATVNGFFILMLIFLAGGIFDFIMINASDDATALVFARAVFFTIVLIFAGFLFISTQLTFIPLGKWFEKNRYLYYAVSVIIGLIVAFNLKTVGHNEFGYGPARSYETVLAVVVVTFFAAATLSLLVKRWFASDDLMLRSECILLSLAVLMPYLWGVFLLALEELQVKAPFELSPGFLVSTLIIADSIKRHGLFTLLPVSEDRSGIIGAKEAAVLPIGSYLLYEETKADGMFETLLSQVSNGVEGLIVTRTYPEDLREKYGLKRTPVIWLCSQPGQDRVDPTNLSILEHNIIEFLKVGHNTVVAIDGLEYLISNNGVTRVLRMLYGLRDEILMNESRMIVTLDPAVLDEKELAFFERDFKVVQK